MSGELSALELVPVAEHLETCSDCLALVQTLPPTDTLASCLAQANELPIPPDEEAVNDLIAKLKELPSVLGEPEDLGGLLTEPQAPDEIGRLGPYRILEVLGQGGMGIVFKAEDPALERLVAIKAMLPSVAAIPSGKVRFLREARAAAALKHDNIVSIYQVGEDRGIPYLAMELLAGETLQSRLDWERPLPIADILRIGRQIAEGLAAAHARGLIHRDIKPANIWLETAIGYRPSAVGPNDTPTESRVKLLDFGLARTTSDSERLSQAGKVLGTPAFMAPEQANGKGVDQRSDLFGLGCVLYLMAVGELPFLGTDMMSTLLAVAAHEPAPARSRNPKVPPDLSDLIQRLLVKDPNQRPQSAQEVAASLHQLEGRHSEQSQPDTMSPQPSRGLMPAVWKQRRTGIAIGGALFILFSLLAGVVYLVQTADGTVRMEVNDPALKVSLDRETIKIGEKGHQDIRIKPGKHTLHIERDDFAFDSTNFEIKKNETVRLRVEWLPEGKVQVLRDGTVLSTQTTMRPVAPRGTKFALQFQGNEVAESEPIPHQPSIICTFEAWVTSQTSNQSSALILKTPNGELTQNGREFWFYTHHGHVIWAPPDGFTGRMHLAGVDDGQERRLYVNGKFVAKTNNAGSVDPFASAGRIRIGFNFQGTIDAVRVSTNARYAKDFVPEERLPADKDTLVLYRFDEGQGDVLHDASGNNYHCRIRGAQWVRLPAP